MCNKCHGRGIYYTQPMAGIWTINPCPCEYGMQNERETEQFFENFRKRVEEAYGTRKKKETKKNILCV